MHKFSKLIDITEILQNSIDNHRDGNIWSPLFGYVPLRMIRVVPNTQIYVDWNDGVSYVFDKYGRYNMYEYDDGKVRTSLGVMLLPDDDSIDWKDKWIEFYEYKMR